MEAKPAEPELELSRSDEGLHQRHRRFVVGGKSDRFTAAELTADKVGDQKCKNDAQESSNTVLS